MSPFVKFLYNAVPLLGLSLTVGIAQGKPRNRDSQAACQIALTKPSLALQIHPPTSRDKPTYLLLPGVNRSALLTDPESQALFADGSGVVAMNFQAQPFSLAELPADKSPAFLNQPVTLESLAREVEQTHDLLKTEYGIKNVIPVSLSFSGAVSPYLKGFPVVIEVVPMTSTAAFNPTLESFRKLWSMNPFLGRSVIDQAYRSTWGPQVDSIASEFNLPTTRRAQMIDGYMALTHASEGANWEDVELDKKVKRFFVLGIDESPSLFKHQVTTILRLMNEGYDVHAIIVKEAGHMLFAEQPATYAKILQNIGRLKQAAGQPSVLILTPSTGEETRLKGEAALAYLEKISAI